MARQESSFDMVSSDGILEKILKTEKEPKIVAKFTDILSILSKTDALTIFSVAKNGLKSELDTPKKIGLTKKQYYTRLKQLYDLKLVTKINDSYVHTTFGSIIYEKHVMGLIDSMENVRELEMIDLLKKSSKFNNEEISGFLSKMGIKSSIDSNVKRCILISSYECMISKALEMIEFAQKEVLLSTRFLNELVVNGNLKKANSGVHVKVIADKGLVTGYFGKEPIFKEDKNKDERTSVVSNPYYPTNIERRYADVPFSMLMADGKQVGIEIIDNYNPLKFKMALFIDDGSVASAMKSYFYDLWQYASANPAQLVQKKN